MPKVKTNALDGHWSNGPCRSGDRLIGHAGKVVNGATTDGCSRIDNDNDPRPINRIFARV
jgi:hypothetical protein